MSITVTGADATYSSVTYGGNTGTLYEFTNPAVPGSIVITGSLTSSDGKFWLIGGGGGGGGYNTSNGGGGGGGEVINGPNLSALTAGTYSINVANTANSGAIGNATIISVASTPYMTAHGGGYGSGGDSEEDGGASTNGINGADGGTYPGGIGNAGLLGEYGGSGGAGGDSINSSFNGGGGGSANAAGDASGNVRPGIEITGFAGTLPARFVSGYTFGDGGAAGQVDDVPNTRYGSGGNGGNSVSAANQGMSGAVYIFVVDPPSNDLEFGIVSNITSSGFTVEFSGGDGAGVIYTANATTDTVSYNSPFVSGTINSSTKIITFTGLESLTSYGIVLTASNGGGEVVVTADLDTNSNPFTTSAGSVPSTPPALTFVSRTSSSITVSGDNNGVGGSPFTTAEFYSQTGVGYDILNTNIFSETDGILTIEYTGLSPSTTYNLTWLLKNSTGSGLASDPLAVTTLSGGNPPCFLRGSKILCLKENKEQYVAVEDMRVGMEVKTLNGTYVKVHTIGKTLFNNPDNADRGPNRLFRLTPSNYPELTEDLIITGCHSRLVDKLEPNQKARHLQLMKTLYMTTGKFRLMAFIDEKAEPYQNPGKHEIWHFALENEEVVCNYGVYANGGLLVETANIKTMVERSGLVLIE